MRIRLALIALLVLSLFLETSLFAFPFLFIFSMLLYVLYPEISTIFLVIFCSLVLDSLKLSQVGLSAVLIIFSFGVVEFLRKFFDFRDYKIILGLLFLGSIIFSIISVYSLNLLFYFLIFGLAYLASYAFYRKFVW